jgi:protein gp37
MKKEWVVSLEQQCLAYGVPFFFKQWGGVRKVKHGREPDSRTYGEYPRRAVVPVPD